VSTTPRLRLGACTCAVAIFALCVPALAGASATPVGDVPAVNAAGVPVALPIQLPVSTGGSPSTARMVSAIDSARTDNGLKPLRVAAPIQRASGSYAKVLARTGRFQHARQTSAGRFKLVSEILGLAPGTNGMIGGVVNAWLHSPVHRHILLDHRYRYVGVGMARGTMNGQTDTFWVVRFSR
jgi:uncharacterized protein YkwD